LPALGRHVDYKTSENAAQKQSAGSSCPQKFRSPHGKRTSDFETSDHIKF